MNTLLKILSQSTLGKRLKGMLRRTVWGKQIIFCLKKIRSLYRNIIIYFRYRYYKRKKIFIPIRNEKEENNEISNYWTGHTVHDEWFISAKESMDWRESIFEWYRYYKEFADMERSHKDEVLLDYGCGPGNDLVWYSIKTQPKLIIGMDVSRSALENAQYRLALHGISQKQCQLVKTSESQSRIPLRNDSVDYISCQGVLMHTSFPDQILNEFYRIIKKQSSSDCNACIMVYNKDSLHYHLYVPYYLKYVDGSLIEGYSQAEIEQMSDDELFRRSVDGAECPMARCWTPDEFINMCRKAGFSRIDFMGGYFFWPEVEVAKKYLLKALSDQRVSEEHKTFLRDIKFDSDDSGNLFYKGKLCGRGGVYRLWC